jgi:uncharacterized membrane protein YkvA (DUF1232 family)
MRNIKRKIQTIKQALRYYHALATDKRTPKLAKWCLIAALAYLAMPFDLIPDFIPILGQLDDVIIVIGLIWLANKLIPSSLKEEIRARL